MVEVLQPLNEKASKIITEHLVRAVAAPQCAAVVLNTCLHYGRSRGHLMLVVMPGSARLVCCA